MKRLSRYFLNKNSLILISFLITISITLINYYSNVIYSIPLVIIFIAMLFFNFKQTKLMLVLFILFLLSIFLFFNKYELKNNYNGVGTVIENRKNYSILKIRNAKVYSKNNQLVDLTIGEKVRLVGDFELLKSYSDFYEFDFIDYLNKKNINYEIKIEKISKIKTISLKYFFNKWIDNSPETIKMFIGHRKIEDINENLIKMSMTYVSNFSIYNIYWILYFFRNKKLKKIKHLFNLVFIFNLIYLYCLNFPPILFKVYIFALLWYVCKLKSYKLNRIEKFYFIWTIELIIDPYYIFNIGFIYTVAAFTFIKIENDYSVKKNFIINLIRINMIFIPLQAYYDYKIFWLSEIHQLILMPIMSFEYLYNIILIPLYKFNYLFEWNYFFLESITKFLSKNNLTTTVGHINLFLILSYFTIYFFIINNKIYFNHKYFGHIKMFLYLSCAMLFITMSSYNKLSFNNSVTMLNVKNGNSFHARFNRKNYLFDAGSGYGVSKSKLKNYLLYMGIDKIDSVFLSHNHQDHYDQLNALEGEIKIKNLYYWNNQYKSINYKNLNITNYQYFGNTNENDNSQINLVKIKGRKLLFVGDATKNIEYELLKNKQFLQEIDGGVDFLQVGHHGSKTSSGSEFIKKIKPKISFISSYNMKNRPFPAEEVINNLLSVNSQIFVTNGEANYRYFLKNNSVYRL